MNWVLLPLLAALLWAMVNLTDKIIITKLLRNPLVPVMISGVVALVAGVLVYLIHGFSPLPFLLILLGLVAGGAFLAMNFFYFKAMQVEEASRIMPLMQLSTLGVLIFANIFLHEVLTMTQLWGVLLLVVGSFLISTKDFRHWRFSRAAWFILLAVLAIVINQLITKYLLGFADYWTVFGIIRIGTFLFLVPVLFKKHSLLWKTPQNRGFFVMGIIICSESVTLAGSLLYNAAAAQAPITLVNALASVQPFFVLLLAILFSIVFPKMLKEEITLNRILTKAAATCMMFIGVILVT